MTNRIHVSSKISARRSRRILARSAIACSVLGALLPTQPYITFFAAAAVCSVAVLFGTAGSAWIRVALVLNACAACAVSAWLGSLFGSRPFPGPDLWENVLGIVCLFLIWAGALSSSFAFLSAFAAVDPTERKRAVFRLLLYILCAIFAILVLVMNLRHPALPPGILVCTVLFLLAYIGIGRSFARQLAYSAEDRIRAEALQTELDTQRQQFEQLSAELGVVRSTRHDLNNHLTVVAALVREGRRSEARAYVRSLADSTRRRSVDSEQFAMSLARTKTKELEDAGVRIQYPDVRGLTPLQRAILWPWTELIVNIAYDVLRSRPDAVLRIGYCANPLRISAQFTPAELPEIRALIAANSHRLPNGSVQIGSLKETVQVAVLISV